MGILSVKYEEIPQGTASKWELDPIAVCIKDTNKHYFKNGSTVALLPGQADDPVIVLPKDQM
jgi:hypothetical protein